ncbi:hypothetical protein TNCT_446561 [Trichonephila clavata]|uniref:Uncharacterized protein n=1 Tax=Trichonephila clavata TaxID=2740835 RepID=A0A8X6LBA3_TRICU|nr:hypothetical protein TNCT_446561 [Trichonephila clavata]
MRGKERSDPPKLTQKKAHGGPTKPNRLEEPKWKGGQEINGESPRRGGGEVEEKAQRQNCIFRATWQIAKSRSSNVETKIFNVEVRPIGLTWDDLNFAPKPPQIEGLENFFTVTGRGDKPDTWTLGTKGSDHREPSNNSAKECPIG